MKKRKNLEKTGKAFLSVLIIFSLIFNLNFGWNIMKAQAAGKVETIKISEMAINTVIYKGSTVKNDTGSEWTLTFDAGYTAEVPAQCSVSVPANGSIVINEQYVDGNTVYSNQGYWYIVYSAGTQYGFFPATDEQVAANSVYTITFNAQGGTLSNTVMETEKGGKFAELPTPEREGYEFLGWYTESSGGTKITTNYGFTANTTVYAQWRQLHIHSYELVPEVQATCTTDGTQAHYKCSDESCGKLFTDRTDSSETTLEALKISSTGHTWNYSANKNVITVNCNNEGCTYNTSGVTLILEAEDMIYSGDNYQGASITENHITSVTQDDVPDIYYAGTGSTEYSSSTTAPTEIGTYEATATLGTVTAKAPFEIAAQSYNITVSNNGNGTASASAEKAAAGTEITLSATANSGYHFKEWQVISGGVTITDNKFTMLEGDVEVKAIFEKNLEDSQPATKNDVEKCAEAKRIAENVIAGFTATNATTKEDIINAVKTKIDKLGYGITVKMDYFNNTNATETVKGGVTGTIKLTLNGTTVKVPVSIVIAKLTSTPTTPAPESSGKVENSTNIKDNAFSTNLNETPEELNDKVLTDAEKQRVMNGEYAKIYLKVTDISDKVSEDDKEKIETAKGDAELGMYIDISLYKQIGNDKATKVTNTKGTVVITVKIPENLINKDSSVTRTYQIVRVHNGKTEVINCKYDAKTGTIIFETDAFSTYALVYKDSTKSTDADTNTNTNTNSKSSDNAGSSNTGVVKLSVPKTGDSSNLILWLALIAISSAGMVYFGRKKKMW